jgi:hypothetical protein
MKTKLIIVSVLCLANFFTVHLVSTKASELASQELPDFKNSSKEKNQIYVYFILELYHKEIMAAIKEHYNDDKISGYTTPKQPHHDMISISMLHNKDNKELQKYSYALKIKLLPIYSNGTILGEDTIYFAVEPFRLTMKNIPKDYPTIELISYEHSNPSSKNK